MDAGALDASGPPAQRGDVNSNGNSKVDAGLHPCGSWKSVSDRSAAPDNAVAYGSEAISGMDLGKNYVCRFSYEEGGKQVFVQGRAVVGYGCHAATLLTPTKNASPRRAANFDVLVNTRVCANKGPYPNVAALLPTGIDTDGKPTFTCTVKVPSLRVTGITDELIGRLDTLYNVCLYVTDNDMVATSGTFDVLLGPGQSPVVLEEQR